MIMQVIGKDTRGLGNTRQRCMRRFHWQEEKNRATHPAIFIALLSILFIFINGNAVVLGQNVQPPEKIEFLPESEPEDIPWSFCVTDDDLIMIPDYKAGNIKVYEKEGNIVQLIDTIGRKGYGSDEFVKPTFCFYNKEESKFGIMDFGIRKIFIYDRIGRLEFNRVKEISCWRGAYDIKLVGSKLVISGHITDQNEVPYALYYIDITKDEKHPNQETFILPSYLKYGLKSSSDYKKQFREKPDIPAIGVMGLFDIYRDNVYFVWEGNLKVIKINIASGYIEPKPFGMQPPYYIKPHASEKLLEARSKRDKNVIVNERARMSYVRNIFVSSKYILVIYEGPINQGNASNFRIQFYTFDGDFIKDAPIQGQPGHSMWFGKDENILYSLSSKSSSEDDRNYLILKYQIYE